MRAPGIVVGALVVGLLAGCAGTTAGATTPTQTRSVPVLTVTPTPTPTPVAAVDLTGLPVADPWAVLPAAPVDPDPYGTPSGELAYPAAAAGAALFDAPGGTPFAVLPQQAYVGITGYPVVVRRDGWLQVLLVARRGLPSEVGADGVNSATGWVRTADVTTATVDTTIQVNLALGTVSVVTAGQVTFTSEAGFGAPRTPTPRQRTFVMSIAANPEATYSKVFVYLGSHSPTLDSFQGGPAQIAIHSYATHSGAISNGCLRIPAQNLDRFAAVPLGTPVIFTG